MQKELQLLLPLIENKEEREIDGYRFYKGIIGDHEIIAMQCGIGKVNSAIGTVRLTFGVVREPFTARQQDVKESLSQMKRLSAWLRIFYREKKFVTD